MLILRSSEHLSKEDYDRWQKYVLEHWENDTPIVLPDSFEVYEIEKKGDVELEES